MALRFRTRLNLTITTLVFLVISGMTLTQIGIMIYDTWTTAWTKGSALTQLTNPNIGFGLAMNETTRTFIEDQMVFQAILTSELVELSQRHNPPSDEEISNALKHVLRRSEEAITIPLITEFNITDPSGKTVISTDDSDFTFRNDPDSTPQSGAFTPLLRPNAPPVRQDPMPRDKDRSVYKYIGVSGAHQPRIVQVGSDESTFQRIAHNFSTQSLLQRYMLDDEYLFMQITDDQGIPLAEVSAPHLSLSEKKRSEIAAFIADFLKDAPDDSEQQYSVLPPAGELELNIGVVTTLPRSHPDAAPRALFILYDASKQAEFIGDRLSVLLIIGAVLFILGIVTSIILSRGLSKPLYELAKGAREFGKGNLNYRLRLKRKDEFNALAQSCNTMAISIQEYMHELEQETSQRERLESEFRIAAEMQQMLLPEAPPVVSSLELRGYSLASKKVGGDFYDYLELESGKIAIVLGDATGKGVPAALLTTQCASILRTLAADTHDPAALLSRTNTEFYKRIGSTHRFVTLMLMLIDTDSGTVHYASAGHPPPLLVRAGSKNSEWMVSDAGFPLGIMPEATYHEATAKLAPGDTVLIYSDGYTDAQNQDGDFLSEDGLSSAFLGAAHAPSTEDVFRDLQSAVDRFMNGREATDDMTLVIARYKG